MTGYGSPYDGGNLHPDDHEAFNRAWARWKAESAARGTPTVLPGLESSPAVGPIHPPAPPDEDPR